MTRIALVFAALAAVTGCSQPLDSSAAGGALAVVRVDAGDDRSLELTAFVDTTTGEVTITEVASWDGDDERVWSEIGAPTPLDPEAAIADDALAAILGSLDPELVEELREVAARGRARSAAEPSHEALIAAAVIGRTEAFAPELAADVPLARSYDEIADVP